MALPDKDIETFRALYLRHYGVEIDKKQAAEMGTRLLNLFRAILKPSPQIYLHELNQTKICQQKKT